MDQSDESREPRAFHGGAVIAGLVIIAAGLVMLADQIGTAGVYLSGRYWPLILVVLGVLRVLDPPAHRDGRPRSRRSGVWLMYLGVWGFLNEFHWFGFDYDTSWPLLIVGIGIGTVWRAFEEPRGQHCHEVRES